MFGEPVHRGVVVSPLRCSSRLLANVPMCWSSAAGRLRISRSPMDRRVPYECPAAVAVRTGTFRVSRPVVGYGDDRDHAEAADRADAGTLGAGTARRSRRLF